MENQPVKLTKLLEELPGIVSGCIEDIWINGIVQDSRYLEAGNLFIAYQGGSVDGHHYIYEAIQRGAFAVVGTQDMFSLPVPYIKVTDSRLALAHLAAAFYGFPARKLLVIGVTGTDGKTTTANLLYSILKEAGVAVSMISTVNAVIGNQEVDTGFHVTTPDALEVQKYMAQMVLAGASHVVLETTSHGLAQHRVASCEFDIGVVTNITHEHLDYHGSFEAYRAAKGMLFDNLQSTRPKEFNPPRCAILNRDDASYTYLSQLTHVDQLCYGGDQHSQVWAENIRETPGGLTFTVKGESLDGEKWVIPVSTPLVGAYNVSNCLAAITTCVGVLGVDPENARQSLLLARKVPGRMEFIEMGQDFLAIVDFAHTPNALQRALEAARSLAETSVIAVFGSAGLRDRAKRRMMAEISADLADITILTAEDPRTESLSDILEEMVAGILSRGGVEGESFWRIADRGEAIQYAVRLAKPGDVVITCGKGHEQSMCFGNIEFAWDDRVALRAALSELLEIPGPEMPHLPTRESSTS